MNRPALYSQSFNSYQHIYSEIFKEFGHILKWKEIDDNLLDIGCGPGNVTRDILLSIMPPNFSHIMGVDCSEKILHYAQTHYSHPKISYKYLDIGYDGNVRKFIFEKFNHIVSFNCLHWVPDIEKAFKNVFDLLQPNGDCLLAIVYKGQKCQIFYDLSRTDKWSKYFQNEKRFLPILFHSEDPVGLCEKAMKRVGFKDVQVHMRKRITETTLENCKGKN